MLHTPRLLTGLLIAVSLGACSPQDPKQQVTNDLATHALLPAYQHWHDANQALSASAQAFCAGEHTLPQARDQFTQAQRSWSALQPLALGPLSEGNRAWQVQFWPDKKNLVGRQVETLIKKNPAVDTAALGKASVVVQGLSAYEYLLFDPSLDLSQAEQLQRYCPLLQAIAQHQTGLSADVLELWQGPEGMQQQLTKLPSTRFADSDEALAEILRSQISAIDGLKKKLGTPLGRQSKGVPQPYQAEAWRSQGSLNNIQAALLAARSLWQGENYQGIRSLLNAEQQALAEQIDAAYEDTLKRLQDHSSSLTEQLQSEQGRQALNELYDSLNRLHRLHEADLARALQIALGFNAHDGD